MADDFDPQDIIKYDEGLNEIIAAAPTALPLAIRVTTELFIERYEDNVSVRMEYAPDGIYRILPHIAQDATRAGGAQAAITVLSHHEEAAQLLLRSLKAQGFEEMPWNQVVEILRETSRDDTLKSLFTLLTLLYAVERGE